MAFSPPTGRSGRLLALALTLGVLGLAWAAVGSPMLDLYNDRAERLAGREALAARMAGLASTLPALRRDAARGDGQPELLGGATDAVAAASLQERVQDLAARSGAAVSSLEVLPVQAKGAYREIGVRVSLNATWPVLVRLLQAVSEATPRMLVDDLQLRAAPAVFAAGPQGQGPPRPLEAPLDASVGVFAFRAGAAGR